MQGHLFQLLRPMISSHMDIRDALARCRGGDIAGFEQVLTMVEDAVKQGLLEEARTRINGESNVKAEGENCSGEQITQNSTQGMTKCKRPWWVCQPFIRPLPEQAIASGALTASKKDIAKIKTDGEGQGKTRDGGIANTQGSTTNPSQTELPKEALVCG